MLGPGDGSYWVPRKVWENNTRFSFDGKCDTKGETETGIRPTRPLFVCGFLVVLSPRWRFPTISRGVSVVALDFITGQVPNPLSLASSGSPHQCSTQMATGVTLKQPPKLMRLLPTKGSKARFRKC